MLDPADSELLEPGTWTCGSCGAVNSEIDSDCQFCEGDVEEDQPSSSDPAWQSEAHLRNMEGYGDYEGPVTWP